MEVDRVGRASRRRCEAGAFLLQCECPALCAALTGRTHGCTDQPANVKKTLANSEPSTHGTKRTWRDVFYLSAFGGKADISQQLPDNCDFMSTRPSTTLADFSRHGIPKSLFL